MRTTRRVAVITLAAGTTLLLAATAAWAHVEPDPNRVKPGKEVTVEFTPEHGCGDSVTTEMEFRVPKGARGAAPVEQDGWTTSVQGRTITFESDTVPDDETSFGITFTTPDTKTAPRLEGRAAVPGGRRPLDRGAERREPGADRRGREEAARG